MTQRAIFIYWPSCAWKSTVVKHILEKSSNMFHISIDRIKWLISDYSNQNKLYINTLHEMVLSLAKISLDNWMDIIVEWKSPYIYDKLDLYINSLNIDIFEINIEAPFEVIKERFFQRMKEVEETWWRVWNKSIDKCKEIFDEYLNSKKKNILTLDTSILSEDETTFEINKLINKKYDS